MPGMTGTVLKSIAAAFLQFVAALLVTLLTSFAVDLMPQDNPLRWVLVAGTTFTVGITASGVVFRRLGLLPGGPLYLQRAITALVGVFGVLGIALALDEVKEASPFLTMAILVGIVGFQLPGWLPQRWLSRR